VANLDTKLVPVQVQALPLVTTAINPDMSLGTAPKKLHPRSAISVTSPVIFLEIAPTTLEAVGEEVMAKPAPVVAKNAISVASRVIFLEIAPITLEAVAEEVMAAAAAAVVAKNAISVARRVI